MDTNNENWVARIGGWDALAVWGLSIVFVLIGIFIVIFA